MSRTFVLNDKDIDNAHHFNFATYASNLARTIASPTTQTPLVIGVHGKWGSGKTTLMRTTKLLLDAHRPSPELQRQYRFAQDHVTNKKLFRKVRTVWFNAWKYSGTNDSLAALILQIVREMAQDTIASNLKGQIVEMAQKDWGTVVAKLLGVELGVEVGIGVKGTATWNLGEFLEEFLKGSRVRQSVPFYDDFQDHFNTLIRAWVGFDRADPEGSGVLAVFIDDLDRCPPSRVADVLESLLLFLDTPGCIFVVGADIEYVASAVNKHYSQFSATFNEREYLEKVFQFSFELPPIRRSDVIPFVAELVPEGQYDAEQLRLISESIQPNPRKIKRFLNSVEFWQDLARETPAVSALIETDAVSQRRFEALIMEWIAVCLCHSEFEHAVRNNPTVLLTALLLIAEPEIRVKMETVQPEDVSKASMLEDKVKQYLSNRDLHSLLVAFPVDSLGLPTISEIALVVHLTQAPRLQ